uniref:Uncharacterized protein n=1 Tax=Calidris pygmaea TaxID=425635 RepID=A0A8C3K1J2_9CHAR
MLNSSSPLLLDVTEIVLPLEAFELVEGGGGGLVEEEGHGARLVGFGDQDGVAAQNHRLVLHLVPVNPGEDLGVPAVGGAVGDAVQEVRVARPAGSLLAGGHTDALGSQRQLHLGPAGPGVALRPDLAHRLLRAALPFGVQGDGVAQVPHRVRRILLVQLHFLAFAAEDAAQPLEGAVGQEVRAGA